MKSNILKITGLLVASIMITSMPGVSLNAAEVSAGVTAGMTEVIASGGDMGPAVNAGISATISDCIDMAEKASILPTEDATTASGQGSTESICGYTNLGIARVEGNLNIRQSANEGAELVGKLPGNAGCEIIATEGEWTRMKSGEVEGYVKSEFMATGDEAKSLANEIMSTVAKVTTPTLHVRKEPNTECEIVANMPEGEEIEVRENLGDWVKVSVDEEEGYINTGYVTISNELPKAMNMTEVKYGQGVSDVRVDLVSYACQFVGNPYVWGGTSLTKGADCSGFTLSVFAKYGIGLPRTSRAQAGAGTKINPSEAQPGDLFFYGSGAGINHVAIYIGNGQIVHASSRKTGIKISNAYYRSPVCVVRVLN